MKNKRKKLLRRIAVLEAQMAYLLRPQGPTKDSVDSATLDATSDLLKRKEAEMFHEPHLLPLRFPPLRPDAPIGTRILCVDGNYLTEGVKLAEEVDGPAYSRRAVRVSLHSDPRTERLIDVSHVWEIP